MDAYRSGRRFDDEDRARLQGLDHGQSMSPTPRGWLLGLAACAAMSLLIPKIDYTIRHSALTLNLLPASSMFLVFVFTLVCNVALARWRDVVGLSRQDLGLVFAMTMLINPLPGYGYMAYMTVEQMGSYYYATPENNWAEYIHPYLPSRLTPHDPVDPASHDPRPIEWFFSGLPEGSSLPWDHLIGPYAWWCLALVMVLGMFFAVSALLHRQWSDRERLPFPLAQIPDAMTQGMGGRGGTPQFFKERLTYIGIAVTLLLHSWNALGDYFPKWVPIDLKYTDIDWKYLTEGAWKHVRPVYMNIYPSVIGIMYLISLEVSFSLWFFYIIVLKLGILVAVLVFGLGSNGWWFSGEEGPQSVFVGQGHGAAFIMVLVGFFMARGVLGDSLKQAFGMGGEHEEGSGVRARFLWLLLASCFLGSVAWMVFVADISWYWSVLAVIILVLSATAIARLVSEGGVFFLQMISNPAQLLSQFFTPVALGPQNFVMLSVWSRVFVFDWYRSSPMTNILSALHLGSLTNMRRAPLVAGLAAAMLVTFGVSFYSFNSTVYKEPGGARQFGWAFDNYPRGEFGGIGAKVSKIKAFEKKRADYAEKGREMPSAEIPTVARVDHHKMVWMAVGAAVMGLFLLLRTRLFWWPHPIGYVMWMGPWPIHRMWFTYFLGWLIKMLITKFGGQRVYLKWRNFFIGLIVGEALATFIWIFIAFLAGDKDGYGMHYN
ncbi:MAG: hypothetical protein M5U26_00650 [Planctomycetota bacterium]|nr:hypothetical protein [Planctomycetota bacterium]